MKPTENTEMLALRFVGPELKFRSLPIYELGSALIAIQRIVQKAYLHQEGRLEKGVRLESDDRQKVALQVTDHRKGSDLWGLGPYLTNPAYGPILQGLVVAGVGALSAYALKKVFDKRRPPAEQILVVNIYPEMKTLTDRVGNIGGVEGIEIFSGHLAEKPLHITEEVRDYVREIEHERIPGRRTRITGYITRLYPQSFRLDLEDDSGHFIRVETEYAMFERVRRVKTLSERRVSFEGTPVYRLGNTSGRIEEFVADRVIFHRKQE